jgi:hypothetical protein
MGAGGGEIEFDAAGAQEAAAKFHLAHGGEGVPGEAPGVSEGPDVFAHGALAVLECDGDAAESVEEHGGEQRNADQRGESGEEERFRQRSSGRLGAMRNVGGDADP